MVRQRGHQIDGRAASGVGKAIKGLNGEGAPSLMAFQCFLTARSGAGQERNYGIFG